MAWIRRQADEHRCQPPGLYDDYNRVGDIWQCDEEDCKKMWMIRTHPSDMRNERYWGLYERPHRENDE